MRKLVYYVACTLDGFIARADGSFGDFPWDDEYLAALLDSFPETFPTHLRPGAPARTDNKVFDAVLMGRRTYEVGLREGVTSPYGTLDQYVFSRTLRLIPDASVTLVRDHAAGVVRTLKGGKGKAIWLCGGAHLARSLLSEGLLDELIVKLNPVLFGSGIRLFAEPIPRTSLALTDATTYRSGHMLLRYTLRA